MEVVVSGKYERIIYKKYNETPIEKFERLVNNFFVESRERQKYLKLRFVSNRDRK